MLPSSIDLISFYEVATELHFSRAAKKLNVSQPSLSLAIKRLEKMLNTFLFIRHKRGVTLTRSGTELFNNVKKLLDQWKEITSNIKDTNQCVRGKVRIGCHSTLAAFMGNMVSKLLDQHPGLEIHFQHELTPKIMENIVQGQLDIGITVDPYPNQDIILQKVSDCEFTYWMSSKRQMKIDLYAEDTVIICDPQLPQTQYLIKQLQKMRQHHNQLRLSTMNQIETIAKMTEENCGVGILPTAFTQRYFGNKVKKIPNAPIYKKPLCLAYRFENKNVIAIQVVLNAIKELVQTESILLKQSKKNS